MEQRENRQMAEEMIGMDNAVQRPERQESSLT